MCPRMTQHEGPAALSTTYATTVRRRNDMSDRYSVSKAVVTGGARGIGAAIAERLSHDGLAVTVLDVNEAGARATAERISAQTGSPVFGFGCNVTDRQAVQSAFEPAADAMSGLDTYIGNAGITRDKMFHKLTEEDWDTVIAVNLTGVFNGLQAAAPWLRTPGPGRVHRDRDDLRDAPRRAGEDVAEPDRPGRQTRRHRRCRRVPVLHRRRLRHRAHPGRQRRTVDLIRFGRRAGAAGGNRPPRSARAVTIPARRRTLIRR